MTDFLRQTPPPESHNPYATPPPLPERRTDHSTLTAGQRLDARLSGCLVATFFVVSCGLGLLLAASVVMSWLDWSLPGVDVANRLFVMIDGVLLVIMGLMAVTLARHITRNVEDSYAESRHAADSSTDLRPVPPTRPPGAVDTDRRSGESVVRDRPSSEDENERHPSGSSGELT